MESRWQLETIGLLYPGLKGAESSAAVNGLAGMGQTGLPVVVFQGQSAGSI